MNTNIVRATEEYVRGKLEGEGTGHDWWHCVRVRNIALAIAKEEGADVFIVELASLLHDIADHKFHNGDKAIGPSTARAWLEKNGVENTVVEHVVNIVAHMSWSKSHTGNDEFDTDLRGIVNTHRGQAIAFLLTIGDVEF